MEKPPIDTLKLSELFDIETASRRALHRRNEVIAPRDLDGLFHPSSFGYCTRKLQYHYLGEAPLHKISSSTRSIFDLGHAVHDMLQTRLYTTFQYQFEHSESEYDFTLEVEKSINATPLAEKYELAGSADGLIILSHIKGGEEIRVIYEAKSISKKGWEKLTSPLAKHRMQASIYCEALEASHILFEYFCKDNAASKWYLIPKDVTSITSALRTVDKVRAATEKLTLVKREGSHYECSDCQYLEICKPEGVPF